jgi:FkbM family methyltransferase
MERARRMRRSCVDSIIQHGGWSLSTTLLERMRDFGNYALGAGAASLPIEKSGEAAFLKRLAALWADGDEAVIVDVGAHYGNYARAALAAFNGRARIECFEPDPANYDTLTERLGTKARCHSIGLSDTPGMAQLFANDKNCPSLHPDIFTDTGFPATHSTEVEVDTLDRVMERLGIGRVDLLKLDVEGHELAVLRGAARLLAEGRVRVIQFEFGECNIASRTYLRDFRDLLPDHRLFRISPRGLRPLDYGPNCEVFLLETNYVAAHPVTGLT